jgi:hypothetical protein
MDGKGSNGTSDYYEGLDPCCTKLTDGRVMKERFCIHYNFSCQTLVHPTHRVKLRPSVSK